MSSNPFAVRWWPLLYVVGSLVLGCLWAFGQSRAAPIPSSPSYVPLLAGSVLLVVGTVWPRFHLTFLTGVVAIMFGFMFRGWNLALYPGSAGARTAGAIGYLIIVLGLALTTMFSRRIDA